MLRAIGSISAEIVYQVLYSTDFIEFLDGLIVLSQVDQTQSSQYGAFFVVFNQFVHDLIQTCISALCLQLLLTLLNLHLECIQLLDDIFSLGFLLRNVHLLTCFSHLLQVLIQRPLFFHELLEYLGAFILSIATEVLVILDAHRVHHVSLCIEGYWSRSTICVVARKLLELISKLLLRILKVVSNLLKALFSHFVRFVLIHVVFLRLVQLALGVDVQV